MMDSYYLTKEDFAQKIFPVLFGMLAAVINLRVLYDLPVSKVHTANYRGKARPRAQGKFTKCAAAHAPALAQRGRSPPPSPSCGAGEKTQTSKRRMCTSRTRRVRSGHDTTSWRRS